MGTKHEEAIHERGTLNKQNKNKTNNYYNRKMKSKEPYKMI